MLSLLPSNPWLLHKNNTFPVYLHAEDFSDQLVHFLVSEPFTLKIKKVDTDDEALAVDFIVMDTIPEVKSVYSDLTQLIFNGFSQFANLNDIRTRVLVRNDDQEHLLIGVLARRDQLTTQRLKDYGDLERLATFLNDQFNVTYGPAWAHYYQTLPRK